jgi:hypothetical protein
LGNRSRDFCLTIKICQNLLDRFIMTNCKISPTPMEKGLKLSAKTDSKAVNESVSRKIVGSLIYLIATRPNLSYAMSFISKFMIAQKIEHWTAKEC